jgi:phage host-nuclease inhibitor protein Gam
MTKVLNDNRKYVAMTVEEADRTFALIATLTIDVERISAGYDKRVIALQSECQEKTAPLKERITALEKELTDYINAHPERFEKPRARQLAQGKYGMQKNAPTVEITDENAIIEFSDEEGLYLYSKVVKINKDAIKNAIESKIEVPGASLKGGERSFYSIAKTLLEEARQILG